MIKIKYTVTLIILFISLTMMGQYTFENRDIKLLININYLNDTTRKVKCSIINKLAETIYHSGFASNINHDEMYFYAYSKNEFVIQLGNVSKMIPIDYLISIHPIEPEDTLQVEQTIISKFFNTKNIIYLSFDYLNLSKYDRKTRNKINIIPYPGDDSGILGCPRYKYYCDWFVLEMPFQLPLDTLDTNNKVRTFEKSD